MSSISRDPQNKMTGVGLTKGEEDTSNALNERTAKEIDIDPDLGGGMVSNLSSSMTKFKLPDKTGSNLSIVQPSMDSTKQHEPSLTIVPMQVANKKLVQVSKQFEVKKAIDVGSNESA